MSAVKLVGAAVVVICSYLIGGMFASKESAALSEGEAFLSLIRHIRLCISCYNTPVSEIIASYNDDILSDIGFLGAFDSSWNEALEMCGESMNTDREVRELLFTFGSRLGMGYRDEMTECCDFFSAKLDEHLSKKRAELPKRKKMFSSCALLFGLLIVIILI